MIDERSSKCSSSSALKRNISRTRSMSAVRDQEGNALAAALTAASTSRSPESGTCSMTSAVAGLKTGSDAVPSAGGLHSEPMRLRINVRNLDPFLSSRRPLQILGQPAAHLHGRAVDTTHPFV